MKRLVHPVIALFCALTLHSCTEDYFDLDRLTDSELTWTPDLAFPLVKSSLSASEIIAISDSVGYFLEEPGSLVTLVYTKTVFSETLNQFMQMPAVQGIQQSVSLTPAEVAAFPSGGVNKTVTQNFTLGIDQSGGAQLQTVRLYGGAVSMEVASNFQQSGTITVSMPQLTNGGAPFSQTLSLSGGSSSSASANVLLGGYQLTLGTGGTPNSMPVAINVVLNPGGGLLPTTANSLTVSVNFSGLTMEYADGYFGQFDLVIDPGTLTMDLLADGSITFNDPRMTLRVKNEIGASVRGTVNQLFGNGEGGIVPFQFAGALPNPFTIAPAPSYGQHSLQEYVFNNGNSNIVQVVNGSFEEISHSFGAFVNPGITNSFNFAGRTSAVEVTADVELPFHGTVNNFVVTDTIPFPLDEMGDTRENIERAAIRATTINGFPVDGYLVLYTLDESGLLTDSLLFDDQHVIKSGVLDNVGKVISRTTTAKDFPLSSSQIDHLFGSKELVVKAVLNSTDQAGRPIKIYGEDRLDVRIGLKIKLKADPAGF